MNTEEIDISKLDKAEVLAALYNNSRQLGMGFCHSRGRSSMSVEEAREALTSGDDNESSPMVFDYLHGRVMKVNLKGDILRTHSYDRNNGEGAAYQAIAHLLHAEAK